MSARPHKQKHDNPKSDKPRPVLWNRPHPNAKTPVNLDEIFPIPKPTNTRDKSGTDPSEARAAPNTETPSSTEEQQALPALRDRPHLRINERGTFIRRDHLIPLRITAPDGTLIHQPRIFFDPKGMQKLAEDIREVGQQVPLMVRPDPKEETLYQVWDGERRLRVADSATLNLEWLRCEIIPLSDFEALRATWSTHEREGISAYERAVFLVNLKKLTPGLHGQSTATWDQIAVMVNTSVISVHRLVAILSLPEPILAKFQPPANPSKWEEAFIFNEKHARALLILRDNENLQRRLSREIEKERLSGNAAVRRAEELRKLFLLPSVPDTHQSKTAIPGTMRPALETGNLAGLNTISNILSASAVPHVAPATEGIGASDVPSYLHPSYVDSVIEHSGKLGNTTHSQLTPSMLKRDQASERTVIEVLQQANRDLSALLDQTEEKLKSVPQLNPDTSIETQCERELELFERQAKRLRLILQSSAKSTAVV